MKTIATASRVIIVTTLAGVFAFTPAAFAAGDPPAVLASARAFPTLFAPQTTAPAPEVPPVPARTGLSALVHSTLDDFKALPRRKSTWVILGIGAGAALLARPADHHLNGHLAGSRAVSWFFSPGKVIGSAPAEIAGSVGLYLVGRYVVPRKPGTPATNKWAHLGFDLVRAQIVSQVVVQSMKYAIRRDRPTGECCSFPSGHAASAFASASVLERHLGYRAAWPTLLIATYVGTSRLHDNRHFLSDVVMGSAIGLATGWTVVGRHGRSEYALVPTPVPAGFAISLVRRGERHQLSRAAGAE